MREHPSPAPSLTMGEGACEGGRCGFDREGFSHLCGQACKHTKQPMIPWLWGQDRYKVSFPRSHGEDFMAWLDSEANDSYKLSGLGGCCRGEGGRGCRGHAVFLGLSAARVAVKASGSDRLTQAQALSLMGWPSRKQHKRRQSSEEFKVKGKKGGPLSPLALCFCPSCASHLRDKLMTLTSALCRKRSCWRRSLWGPPFPSSGAWALGDR